MNKELTAKIIQACLCSVIEIMILSVIIRGNVFIRERRDDNKD